MRKHLATVESMGERTKFTWELSWHLKHILHSVGKPENTWTHSHWWTQSYWFVVCPTHVHSVQAKVLVLVLISPHCSFYQSNTHSDEHLHTDRQTGSLNMKWMTDSSCQATESGKLSVHTHTLTIQALFGNVIFSPLKGVPCVSVRVCVFQCVCVFFLDAYSIRAFPYLVFPKAQ